MSSRTTIHGAGATQNCGPVADGVALDLVHAHACVNVLQVYVCCLFLALLTAYATLRQCSFFVSGCVRRGWGGEAGWLVKQSAMLASYGWRVE
jgi:hypothetical protein